MKLYLNILVFFLLSFTTLAIIGLIVHDDSKTNVSNGSETLYVQHDAKLVEINRTSWATTTALTKIEVDKRLSDRKNEEIVSMVVRTVARQRPINSLTQEEFQKEAQDLYNEIARVMIQ